MGKNNSNLTETMGHLSRNEWNRFYSPHFTSTKKMFGIFFSSLMNHMKFIFFLLSTIYSIELIFQSKPPVFKISNLSPLSYMNCRKSRISSANV